MLGKLLSIGIIGAILVSLIALTPNVSDVPFMSSVLTFIDSFVPFFRSMYQTFPSVATLFLAVTYIIGFEWILIYWKISYSIGSKVVNS